MNTLQKTLLISAMAALPFAAQADNTKSSTSQGEMVESSVPSKNPTPPKSPNTGTPAATPTAQGEANASSVPQTDKPASENTPGATMHKHDMPSSGASSSSTVGTPNQTAPSGENPPGGAPMRTGADANSNEGAGTSIGTEKRQ